MSATKSSAGLASSSKARDGVAAAATPPGESRLGLAGYAALVAIALWVGIAMMLVHELGHVAAAWATGGVVRSLELRPGKLSHTLVAPNPSPSVVLWGGFVVGWLAPGAVAVATRRVNGVLGPTIRAWAAFCLLAGGSYLAVGAGERLTDTGQMLRVGWPLWSLVAIGGGVAIVGYALSRRPWADVLAAQAATRSPWRMAASWWAWLIAWCVGQEALHAALQP